MDYVIHPSRLFDDTCAHCLEYRKCSRVPVAEIPRMDFSIKGRDFDPSMTPKVNDVVVCCPCREAMDSENIYRPMQPRIDPRGVTVLDLLDADVIAG